MNNRYLILGAVLLVGFLGWIIYQGFKPLPGQTIADLGREHVDVGTDVTYNSNPPTSGPHYIEWTKKGIYAKPQDDRNLVHSLEHGYIIMSYNCISQPSTSFYLLPTKIYAHGLEDESEASLSASESASSNQNEECHKLVDSLIEIYEKKGTSKLIVVNRPNLDARLALTAWGRLDKWNPSTSSGQALSEEDKKRIEDFINAYHNKGPEATMEP